LPLALANAVMGSFLALAEGGFRWPVFAFTALTITALQVLSNLANDYGDAVSGKDTQNRVGPRRVTVSGLVSRKEMKTMIFIFVVLAVVSGSLLIWYGLRNLSWKQVLFFFGLGLAAIVAAIKYTIGRNPYGYKGMGDVFVFVFFGLVGVIGTYYLHTNWFDVHVVIPAMIIGLMSTAVLNINNLRDIETDRETGKNTLAVQYGFHFARKYHLILIGASWFFALVYSFFYPISFWQWIFLLTLPLFVRNAKRVYHHRTADELNNELKNLALATFLFAVLFGLGLIL
jgi:1,4-dihydroxy-2-naphthoate octaprenyltransferase